MTGMNVGMVRVSLLLAVLALTGRAVGAQSLGDLSRQERAKKAAKTSKEFTNDNLPKAQLAGAAPAADAAAPAGAAATSADGKPAEAAKDGAAAPKPEELEKQYREKAAKLQDDVNQEERRLDLLQRELNLTQQQYYSDPNIALREQNTRADINKRTEEIEKQRAVVDKAKQAITDLEDELRKKQLPAGWAR
jgi:hypothetical protein